MTAWTARALPQARQPTCVSAVSSCSCLLVGSSRFTLSRAFLRLSRFHCSVRVISKGKEREFPSNKPAECGEDSFAASEDMNLMCVADGVGGYRDRCDPGDVSRALMLHVEQVAKEVHTAATFVHPVDILDA